MIGELLQRVTAALDANAIPYMLTGSIASSMYGIPRATNDIDIVISPTRDRLLSMVQLFQRVGLTVEPETAVNALRDQTQFNVIDFPRGLKVDLIVRRDRDFSVTEFDRRETHEVEGMRLTIATPGRRAVGQARIRKTRRLGASTGGCRGHHQGAAWRVGHALHRTLG